MTLPEGFTTVVGLIVGGILLLGLELFLPGAVIGIIGASMLIAGCYYAFHLPVENPDVWGFGAVAVSAAAAGAVAVIFVRSKYARRMVLKTESSSTLSTPELAGLAGLEGSAQTDLRPSGMAEIDGRRIDVVADCAFVHKGSRVRVKKVEGSRVLVEPLGQQ